MPDANVSDCHIGICVGHIFSINTFKREAAFRCKPVFSADFQLYFLATTYRFRTVLYARVKSASRVPFFVLYHSSKPQRSSRWPHAFRTDHTVHVENYRTSSPDFISSFFFFSFVKKTQFFIFRVKPL